MFDISEELAEAMIQLLLDHLNQTNLETYQAIIDCLSKVYLEIGLAMDKGNYGQPMGPLPNAHSMGSSLCARM